MTKYYAAVDMGASSGRLILGHLEDGKIVLEEIHRFENGMVKKMASFAGNLTEFLEKSRPLSKNVKKSVRFR